MNSTTTIVYNPRFDDFDYKKLIEKGFVLNGKGEVTVSPPDPEELKKRSVQCIEQVVSGRGMFDAWKSNMQKMIRRGRFHEAKASFVECGQCGGPFLSNIVNRLCRTISVEDIGIANVNVIHEAAKVFEYYENHKKEGFTVELQERAFKLIKLMCQSPKSRTSDVLFHYLKGRFSQPQDSVEEVFKEFGRSLRGKEYERACYLAWWLCYNNEPLKPISGYKKCKIFGRKKKMAYDVFSSMLQCVHLTPLVRNVILDLVKLYDLKEGDDWILLLNCGILCLCFSDKLSSKVPLVEVEEKKDEEVWIDDISYDKHTRFGRSLGRDVKFFWESGCKLSHLSHIPEIARLDEELYEKMLKSC